MGYVIMFKDGGFTHITDAQEDQIVFASGKGEKELRINGEFISFSSISRIPTEETFYRQFPDRRPEEVRDNFGDKYLPLLNAPGNQQIRKPSKRAAELMLQGFKSYFLEKGYTEEQVEQKTKEFLKSGAKI
jgi:hypothetical protein